MLNITRTDAQYKTPQIYQIHSLITILKKKNGTPTKMMSLLYILICINIQVFYYFYKLDLRQQL